LNCFGQWLLPLARQMLLHILLAFCLPCLHLQKTSTVIVVEQRQSQFSGKSSAGRHPLTQNSGCPWVQVVKLVVVFNSN